MPRFPDSARTWQSDAFAQSIKAEIEALGAEYLPLDQGVTQGGFVADENITAIVLNATGNGQHILAHVGVFFNEIVAGCNCGDEPDSINVYCKLEIRIDSITAEAEISVVPG